MSCPNQKPNVGWFEKKKQRFPILQKKRGKVLLIALLCTPLLALLGLLALRNRHGGATYDVGADSEGVIREDTNFYGQSEPVYPSRKSPSLGLGPPNSRG